MNKGNFVKSEKMPKKIHVGIGRPKIQNPTILESRNDAGPNNYDWDDVGVRCDVCDLDHSTDNCPLISSGVRVEDAPLPKKAILTIPDSLEYVEGCSETGPAPRKNCDIKSKYGLPKGVQFGPMDAPKQSKLNSACQYTLKIFKGTQLLHYLDTSDEDKCNWMILVRFTEDVKERNCICYQLKGEIYFSVVEDIPQGRSLIVAYSPGYLALLNGIVHPVQSLDKAKPRQLKEKSPVVRAKRAEVKVECGESYPEGQANDHQDHDYLNYSCSASTARESDSVPEGDGSSLLRRSHRKRKAPVNKEFPMDLKDNDEKSDTDFITDDDDNHDIPSNESTGQTPSTSYTNKKAIRRRLPQPQRSYAVRALAKWQCKFCHQYITTMEEFAKHLIHHYKGVGAARTEKSRLLRSEMTNILVDTMTEMRDRGDVLMLSSTDATEEEENKVEVEPSYPYICDICVNYKICNRAEYLIRHLRKHSGELQCSNCSETFSSKEMERSHDCLSCETTFKCLLCKKAFSSNVQLKHHLLTSHGNASRCKNCSKLFNAGESHTCVPAKSQKLEDVAILFKCEVCEKAFLKQYDLEKHLKCHDVSSFTCSVCRKLLSNENLKIHAAICQVLQQFLESQADHIVCPSSKCGCIFKSLVDFKNHMANHTHPFMCSSCKVRLKTAKDIRFHVCAKLLCDGCTSSFSTLEEFKSHILKFHDGYKGYCFECAYPFVTLDGYVNHKDCEVQGQKYRSRLSKPKPVNWKSPKDGSFICEICGATYQKWSSMKTHISTHGPKKHKCEKCGKSFHRKEMLADHIFVHEEAKFKCKTCNPIKKFKTLKSLCVHNRIHNGLKPFKCSICEKAFTQKVNLSTHMRTHVPEDQKGFLCSFPQCKKKLASKEYLKVHEETHKSDKKYVCDVCNKKFVRIHLLNQHKNTSHANHKFRCEFCAPNLFLRQKHSLVRHLKTRHSNFVDTWSAADYLKKMYIPGDGMLSHPGLKARMSTPFTEFEISNNQNTDEDNDSSREDNMTMMTSGSVETEYEIETEEVQFAQQEIETEEGSVESGSVVLIQLDNSGRYMLAFPQPTAQTNDSEMHETEQEYNLVDNAM